MSYKTRLFRSRVLMYLAGMVPVDQLVLKKSWCWWRCLQSLGTCYLICQLFSIRTTHLDRVVEQMGGDTLSNCVELIGNIMLTTVHLVVQLESIWKLKHFKDLDLHFERLCQLFQVEFQCPLAEWKLNRCYSYAFRFFVIYLVNLTIAYFVCELEVQSFIYVLNASYSELALRAKLFELQTLLGSVLVFQTMLHEVTKGRLHDIDLCRFEPWSCRSGLMEKFEQTKELHAALWTYVRLIIRYYEFSFPSLLMKCFSDLTLACYWIYLRSETETFPFLKFYGYMTLITQLLDAFIMCYMGNECRNLDKKLNSLLMTFVLKERDANWGACMRRVSLQMFHEPIYITASGFADVNLRSFGKFVMAANIYVVILIQFRMSAYV